jgi:hypothetical protein
VDQKERGIRALMSKNEKNKKTRFTKRIRISEKVMRFIDQKKKDWGYRTKSGTLDRIISEYKSK